MDGWGGWLLIPLAYLMGSISSAIIVCKIKGLKDPRELGSGNPGATNVLRYGGKAAALYTLLGDMLKGLLPVLLGHAFGVDDAVIGSLAVAAVLGHVYPVFFGFKGGKGVATLWGGLLGIDWTLGLSWALTWGIVAGIFRFSSLAALVATILVPLYTYWLLGSTALVIATALLAVFVVWRHRSNIVNLLSGNEGRIGEKAG